MDITLLLFVSIISILLYFIYKYYLFKRALNTIPGSDKVNLITSEEKFKSDLIKLINEHQNGGIFKVRINHQIKVIITGREVISDFLCPSNSKCVKKISKSISPNLETSDSKCPIGSIRSGLIRTGLIKFEPIRSGLISLPDSEQWKNLRRLITCSFQFRSIHDLNQQLDKFSSNLINTFSNNNNQVINQELISEGLISEGLISEGLISYPVIGIRKMVTGLVLDSICETLLSYKLSRSKLRDEIISLFANELISLKKNHLWSEFSARGNSDKGNSDKGNSNKGFKALDEVVEDAFESRKEQLRDSSSSFDQDKNMNQQFGFTLIDCLINQHLSSSLSDDENNNENRSTNNNKNRSTNSERKNERKNDERMGAKRKGDDERIAVGMSKQSILNEMKGIIVAGVEPVSSILTWILIHLSQDPSLVQRMRMEIDEEIKKANGTKQTTIDEDGDADSKDGRDKIEDAKIGAKDNEDRRWKSIKSNSKLEIIQKVTLIDSLIQEVINLHPPVEFLERKVVKNVTLSTPSSLVEIPSGVTVIVCSAFENSAKDGKYQDENQDKERYDYQNLRHSCLEVPPLNLNFEHLKVEKKKSNHFPSFGLGIRRCLGEMFALQLLRILVAEFIQHFDITPDLAFQKIASKNLASKNLASKNLASKELASKELASRTIASGTLSEFHSENLVIKRRR